MQRLLAAHPDIATRSEPWLLLAPFFARRERGALALYGHRTGARALDDLFGQIPRGEDTFRAAIRAFAETVYDELAAGRRFFIDKTPRYHLIASELMETFPDARFVFLWRNPLAVAASMVETFGRGRWVLHRFEDDLFRGSERLLAAQAEHKDRRTHVVRYEDLITNAEATIDRVLAFLGLEPQGQATISSERAMTGRMGDHTGIEMYDDISTEPNMKWPATMANPLRKAWCRNYLTRLGAERCSMMGYDQAALRHAVDASRWTGRRLVSDAGYRVYGTGYVWVRRRALG
jgi:hypothetical protein